MAFVNKFIRFLTKRHDQRIARRNEQSERTGHSVLSSAEKIPSAMVAFSIIETNSDEDKIIHLLQRIFDKNENVKRQYGAAGETLLYCAYKLGHLKVGRFLINNEVNPLQVTILGSAHHAVLEAFLKRRISFADFKQTSSFLSSIGCDIDAVNHHNMSPFLCAIKEQSLNAVTIYVDLGCDYNLQGHKHQHAFHICCGFESPCIDIFDFLLTLPDISTNCFDEKGFSPLLLLVDKAFDLQQDPGQVSVCRCSLQEQPRKLRSQTQFVGMCEALFRAGLSLF